MERKRIAQQAAAPDETLSFIDYRPDLYDTMLASRCQSFYNLAPKILLRRPLSKGR